MVFSNDYGLSARDNTTCPSQPLLCFMELPYVNGGYEEEWVHPQSIASVYCFLVSTEVDPIVFLISYAIKLVQGAKHLFIAIVQHFSKEIE